MLKSLGGSEDKSRLTIIIDSITQSGHPLFRCALQNSIKSGCNVTLVLFEASAESYLTQEQIQLSPKDLNVLRPDLGWLESSSPSDPLTDFSRGCLFLDSLDPLLISFPAAAIYRKLHKLLYSPQVTRVVLLVHGDTQDETLLPALKHLCTLTIHLTPPDSSTRGKVRAHLTGTVPGHKHLNKHEQFTTSPDGEIDSQEFVPEPMPQIPVQVDLSNLTFNVGLSEDEKRARENLVLPYIKLTDSSGSGGDIFYQPDANDDFDEEDPDDDLNI